MIKSWQPNAHAVSTLGELTQVLADGRVVVVRAWAIWNGIDRDIEPMVEQFRLEYEPRLKVVSVDVDNAEFWNALRDASVMNVPAFLVFSQGRHLRTIQNAPSSPELLRRLSEAVDQELPQSAA